MEDRYQIHQTVNHLFRQESGQMIAVLVKIFGIENLEMAEDVVQDALLKALEVWKFNGMPDNPKAWLYKTARNKAIDIIRKNKHSNTIDFSDPERQLLTSEYSLSTTMNNFWIDDQIKDDFLAMMFACCDPELSKENQVTFILKSLCGFSTKEVAKSFLTSEDTISKRLYRTKEYFRTHKIRPRIPDPDQLESRLDAVLSAIYLLFNEGYNATNSERPIREDLIGQAMVLCDSLLESEKIQSPKANALMALMCFHSARLDSRLSAQGQLILLDRQDRSSWNQNLISSGNEYMNQAAGGDKISSYHLEAAIAYEHCIAKSYSLTNWTKILEYYEAMLSESSDPVVYLNRCLVIMELHGPEEALEELKLLKDNKRIKSYYLYHAIIGTIHGRLGRPSDALNHFTAALELTQSAHEKELLVNRIATFVN